MCSVADELRSYLDRHDIKAISNTLGCKTSTAYRKLNPHDANAGLHIAEAPLLCNGLKDYRLIRAINAACGMAAFHSKISDDVGFSDVTKEFGEALVELSKAFSDGKINTRQEATDCLRELTDMVSVATSLMRKCQDILAD